MLIQVSIVPCYKEQKSDYKLGCFTWNIFFCCMAGIWASVRVLRIAGSADSCSCAHKKKGYQLYNQSTYKCQWPTPEFPPHQCDLESHHHTFRYKWTFTMKPSHNPNKIQKLVWFLHQHTWMDSSNTNMTILNVACHKPCSGLFL